MSKLDWNKTRKSGAVLGGQLPSNRDEKLPSVMPWGKYKNLPINQLPREYIYWLIAQLNNDRAADSNLYLALIEQVS